MTERMDFTIKCKDLTPPNIAAALKAQVISPAWVARGERDHAAKHGNVDGVQMWNAVLVALGSTP